MRRRLVWIQGGAEVSGDFAVINYRWQTGNGYSLDPVANLLIPDYGSSVTWNNTLVSGVSGTYISWQGPRFSGNEKIFVFFDNIKKDFVDPEIHILLWALWFGAASEAPVTVNTQIWATFSDYENDAPPLSEIEITQSSRDFGQPGAENIAVLTYDRNTSAIAYINP